MDKVPAPPGMGGSERIINECASNTAKSYNQTPLTMSNIKILIVKSSTINTLPASAIEIGKVPALAHESGYDPVEDTASVAVPFFAGAERFEVGCRFGDDVPV